MKNNYVRSRRVIYKFALLIMGMMFCLSAGSLHAAGAASFECQKAKTWIEKLICEDEDLTDLDRKMSAPYKELISLLSPQDKREVKKNHTGWLKTRDRACNIIKIDNAVINYLYFYYTERIAELKEWHQYVKEEGAKKVSKPWRPICWKRETIMDPDLATGLRAITGNDGICRTYEQVLETICEPPEKIQCTYNLALNEIRFTKPVWVQMDSKEYPELIDDLIFGKEHDKKQLRTMGPDFVKAYEEGKIRLEKSVVDIDNDGRLEDIVKINWRQNCPASGTYGVLDPTTKRMDWKYKRIVDKMNDLVDSAEILIYKEKTYAVGCWGNVLKIWDGEATSYNQKICDFKYLKGAKRK